MGAAHDAETSARRVNFLVSILMLVAGMVK